VLGVRREFGQAGDPGRKDWEEGGAGVPGLELDCGRHISPFLRLNEYDNTPRLRRRQACFQEFSCAK
jgi:hypothetical protein